ncbi:Hypothetical Protein FCC1311_060842 [Hondaea fermentalgiana]|uniref:Uncharacterized protein n=1 Tax=Hondaea fermentalgiana TaxID=2315210 RepID=A0A2R5GPQ7_9STRA|nr:Hypothetical Protein FCC1311_060842 [Hondaea fermentalgiana]|eukprot:GBG29864.1 Hypothetical Protein FCC1311_060842 [Hondaea fermentalgiana]
MASREEGDGQPARTAAGQEDPASSETRLGAGRAGGSHFGDLMGAGLLPLDGGDADANLDAHDADEVAKKIEHADLDATADARATPATEPRYKGLNRACASQRFGAGSPFLPARVGKDLSPLERILATANGNLQRIVSSWCNRSVRVQVVRNEINEAASTDTKVVYDRCVELWCEDSKFGMADSIVTIESPKLMEAVSSGRVGIGQLFRQFDMLPAFELLSVVAPDNNEIDRVYRLSAVGIMCEIHELLDASMLPSPPVPTSVDVGAVNAASSKAANPGASDPASAGQQDSSNVPNHYGDLMAGTATSVNIHDGQFRPFERVLLTANGNVQRLLSSFLDEPIRVHVMETGAPVAAPEAGFIASFNRHAQLRSGRGDLLCDAKSLVRVRSQELAAKVESGLRDIGAVFGTSGSEDAQMPHFELVATQRLDGSEGYSLSRTYELSTADASVIVVEQFQESLFENDKFM